MNGWCCNIKVDWFLPWSSPRRLVVVVAAVCRELHVSSLRELHPRTTDPDLISNFLNISIYLLHVVKLMFIEYFCNRISVFYYAYKFITVVTISQMTRRTDDALGSLACDSLVKYSRYNSLPSARSTSSNAHFLIRVGVNGGFDETMRHYFLWYTLYLSFESYYIHRILYSIRMFSTSK